MVDLNGRWQFKCVGNAQEKSDYKGVKVKKSEYEITIPGSVLSGLLDNKIIGDPYYRMNEYAVRETLRNDFIFSREFEMKKEPGEAYELVCEGLDTIADVYVNDVLLDSLSDMHTRYVIPCGDVLHDGNNSVKIYFHSAIEYVENYVSQKGKEIHFTAAGAMKDNQFIRKAHSMFGWDWGPQLPDMGIWRNIYIRNYSVAVLENVRISQTHNYDDKGSVCVKAESYICLNSKEQYGSKFLSFGDAVKKCPGISVEFNIVTPDEERLLFKEVDGIYQCEVVDPQLWWPNGYGKQPLYTVEEILKFNGNVIDRKIEKIGLRTFTVSTQKDKWGNEFSFCINGVKIFAKGANYIPEDNVYSWISKDRIHYLIDSAVDVGFNCLRVWGGGYYPSHDFFDYCDEKGIIVWQDFMFACNVYELTDEFKKNIIEEVTYNIRRLRNHASLGLWCGNNEMEVGWHHWPDFCDHSEALKEDYLEIFENIIPDIVSKEDPQRFYWPSSPSSGGGMVNPDSDDCGDRHYWDVWHGEKPFSDYKNHTFRFCSEFGFQSWPAIDTIKTFTLEEDRNIFSEVMESHQKNESANGKILKYISQHFLYPKDFESLIYVSQVLQAIAIKTGVEHFRQNRDKCMGSIYWQLNDNWPVASWSSIDYFGRWKALHYMARHFYAPVLGSLDLVDKRIVAYVQNETLNCKDTNVRFMVKDMDCNILKEEVQTVHTEPLSVSKCDTFDVSQFEGSESEVVVDVVFEHFDGSRSHQVCMLKPYKHMNLKRADIKYTVERNDDNLIVRLHSNAVALFVEVSVSDMIVNFSDNFIDITDTDEHVIQGRLPKGCTELPQITVRSLRDSY